MKPSGTDTTIAASGGETSSTGPNIADGSASYGTVGYQLGAVIGRGGMGEVIAAHDPEIGRDVALKRMRTPQARPEQIARFLREARIQARLDHPAIVPVHEVGRDSDGNPYFTMKRLTGVTLATLLERGTESPTRLLRAFAEVCLAVELAHSRRVVHRDLKPANIMLGDFGEVYVLDWGVARLLAEHDPTQSQDGEPSATPDDTQVGAVLGTPGYMSPEQLRGEPVGPAADVYALGAILFEILTRERLHTDLTGNRAEPDGSPAHRRPDLAIAPELDAACVAALAREPAARPTARKLAERIQRYLDGDRDLERRRTLAVEQLAGARQALADGRRAEAIHTAGRALALDPESVEAAELVTKLIVEPPATLPSEVAATIDELESEMVRTRSRRSSIVYLAIFVIVPVLPFLDVANWAPLLATFVAASALAVIQYFNARTARLSAQVIMVANLILIVLFSRISGSLLLTPLLSCTILLAMGSRHVMARRPVVMAVWALVVALAPFVLEQIGVLAHSVTVIPGGIVSGGTIFNTHGTRDLISNVGGTVAFLVLVALYASAITRDRYAAQRRLNIQAWHLRQLLPQATR